MEMTDVRGGLLVQTPSREVLKVSTVYPPTKSGTGYVTAQVLYPMQPRTVVRSYLPDAVAEWREPTRGMLRKYEAAWGFR